MDQIIVDKIRGCMFGQAIGDALGLGTESMTKKDVDRNYSDGLSRYSQIIQDRHRSQWHKGDWTDDTAMWMCIARAIIERDGRVDLTAIAKNFKDWHNGTPLGCGRHTNKVLFMDDYVKLPIECSKLWWELSRGNSAANGGLMRTSIIGLLPDYKPELAEDVCKLTHYDPRCVGSCVILCDIIHSLVYSDKMLSVDAICETADKYDSRIREYVIMAYNGGLENAVIDDESRGYTLTTLFVALWAYFHVDSFEEGLLTIVNAGGDADTNAAVAGSVLGAKLGYSAIPECYVNGLYRKAEMDNVASKFISIIENH